MLQSFQPPHKTRCSTIGPKASVTLSGPNTTFLGLAGLAANQGSFSLLGGRSFATTGSFTNSGKLTLSPGSVLTVNGKAEIVVQDAKSYQRLLDLAERLETIEAVKEGLASVERGEGRPMDEVFDALEKTLRAKTRP